MLTCNRTVMHGQPPPPRSAHPRVCRHLKCAGNTARGPMQEARAPFLKRSGRDPALIVSAKIVLLRVAGCYYVSKSFDFSGM